VQCVRFVLVQYNCGLSVWCDGAPTHAANSNGSDATRGCVGPAWTLRMDSMDTIPGADGTGWAWLLAWLRPSCHASYLLNCALCRFAQLAPITDKTRRQNEQCPDADADVDPGDARGQKLHVSVSLPSGLPGWRFWSRSDNEWRQRRRVSGQKKKRFGPCQ
jgi:hypothetical protein